MAGIVALLAIVVVVGFVGWTLYKRRLQREYPRMVRITKDDISTYESSFQYEIIPTVSGKTACVDAPSTSEIGEEAEEQYQNIAPSEIGAQAQSASLQRDSVYEIDTLETEANPRYTLLNVGNRDVVSVYTPLQIGNLGSTPRDNR
ncbi:uncharacterized protein [Diadema antillarum]|uniref:uncharacterized protein n=1 Tax=Diadema antillarum TaxID=105358 RepID=UPI003A87DDA2